ncbi:MAG TPA: hemerythrin domain-containing protein [Candidatus Kryptonia bacterium]
MHALYAYLAGDHERLDALLDESYPNSGVIDQEKYSKFRSGLLRHIGIEEKIVFPVIARLQGGNKFEAADKLRLDHGALVALLVPPPSATVINTIRALLEIHNELEEKENGVYSVLDGLAGVEAAGLLEKMKLAPEVPVLPHNDRPGVIDAACRALQRAGYLYLARSLKVS